MVLSTLLAVLLSVVLTVVSVKVGGAVLSLIFAALGFFIVKARSMSEYATARDFFVVFGTWSMISGFIGFIVGLIIK